MAIDIPEHTATRQRVASIWSEVLGADTIADDEGFLALGGDSIAAMLCANRIWTIFGVEVDQGALLDPQMTVRRLAAEIDGGVFPSSDQNGAQHRG